MNYTKPKQRKRRRKRMAEPLTEELLKELLAAPSAIAYADANQIGARTLPEYLQQLLDEKGLDRAAVVREAGLNATHGYQVFMGQRRASRDKVLQLAFAMDCTLQETNRLLQAAGCNELYCKNRRDAIIIFGLDRKQSLLQVNEDLYRFSEETVG